MKYTTSVIGYIHVLIPYILNPSSIKKILYFSYNLMFYTNHKSSSRIFKYPIKNFISKCSWNMRRKLRRALIGQYEKTKMYHKFPTTNFLAVLLSFILQPFKQHSLGLHQPLWANESYHIQFHNLSFAGTHIVGPDWSRITSLTFV